MMFLLFLSALLAGSITAVPISTATDCGFPNGTDKALHEYMCATGEQFDIIDIQCTDNNGKDIYPIDPRVPFILNLTVNNHGPQIDDNKVNVKLYQYGIGWYNNQCTWNEVPTFGLLNNIDGCDFAKNCPLTTGMLYLILPLDLSQYAQIISTLAHNKPYELEIRMYNWNKGDTKHEEIACVMVQTEFS